MSFPCQTPGLKECISCTVVFSIGHRLGCSQNCREIQAPSQSSDLRPTDLRSGLLAVVRTSPRAHQQHSNQTTQQLTSKSKATSPTVPNPENTRTQIEPRRHQYQHQNHHPNLNNNALLRPPLSNNPLATPQNLRHPRHAKKGSIRRLHAL